MPISNRDDLAEVDVEVRKESEAAILVYDGRITAWIPKSQCEDWPNVGQTGTLLAQEWILIEKGLV